MTSEELQLRLENSLLNRLAGYGSMEYRLTWSYWVTASGLQVLRRRASARRTSGNGYSGWPTPDASVAQDGEGFETWEARRLATRARLQNGNGFVMPLTIAAQLAGCATPQASHI